MKYQQSFKGYSKTQVIPKIFKIKSVKSLLKTKLIGISKKSDSILRHLPGPSFLHPPQYETVAYWVNVKWNKGTWSLFSIKKQTVGYLLKKKAHLWLLTLQWPLERQKVPSACTEESIQTVFKLAEHWKQENRGMCAGEDTSYSVQLCLSCTISRSRKAVWYTQGYPSVGLLILISF